MNFDLIVGADGTAEGFSGPGSVTFDSPSVIDSWSRLPVNNMVAASWGYYNMVLPHGEVIKRYTAVEAAHTDHDGVPRPTTVTTS